VKTLSHDFVTVDMRGLKAPLVARAKSQRVSLSVLVRGAVARELGLPDASNQPLSSGQTSPPTRSIVKLSIRLTRGEAEQLDFGAHRAGLSRSAFLAGLLANVPALSDGSASRLECLAALTASSAELSTLSRDINHLTMLLGHKGNWTASKGEVRPAQEYRRMLEALSGDVRVHLSLASRILAALRPRGRAVATKEVAAQ
jgi:hypothetical protein